MKKSKLFDLGIMIIFFVFINILISSIIFIFKGHITIMNLILSCILTIIMYLVLIKKNKYNIKETLLYPTILILIVIGSISFSTKIYDNTYDGNNYHKTAIGELKLGWNPVYESIKDFNNNQDSNIRLQDTYEIWNDHYAKGHWIYAANVYKVTNNIESGKSISMLIIAATFLIGYSFLYNKLNKKTISVILSGLVAINPVILCQFNTFYNDGILGNLIILIIISLTIMMDNKKEIPKIQNYFLYFMLLCIIINIKFTGLAYAGLYSMFYYIYFIINKDQRKNNLKSITITAIISLIVGIGIIGLSTYPKNFKDHHHPFYPLYGEGKVDIMTNNTPTGFHELNRIKRFYIANFSKTYNSGNSGEVLYESKNPFTYEKEELGYYKDSDVRVGGYGVIFGGILILSLIGGIYCLFIYKKEKKNLIAYFIPVLATTSLIFILAESWWARYLPQLYIIPIIVIIMLFNLKEKKIAYHLKNIIIIFLIINSYLMINSVKESITLSNEIINEEFSNLKINDDKKLIVSSEIFGGAIFNVADKYDNIKIDETCNEQESDYQLMARKVYVCKGSEE